MTKVAIIGSGPCGLSMLRSFKSAQEKGEKILFFLYLLFSFSSLSFVKNLSILPIKSFIAIARVPLHLWFVFVFTSHTDIRIFSFLFVLLIKPKSMRPRSPQRGFSVFFMIFVRCLRCSWSNPSTSRTNKSRLRLVREDRMPFADWMWKWRMSFIFFFLLFVSSEEDMRKRERVPRESITDLRVYVLYIYRALILRKIEFLSLSLNR